MKKIPIRVRMTLIFTLILIAAMAVTFFLFSKISMLSQQKTIRSYLFSAVENSVDGVTLQFEDYSDSGRTGQARAYLKYKDGWLEIDRDLGETINGVSTAVYSEDGSLLYGTVPMDVQLEHRTFDSSGICLVKTKSNTGYFVYDRKLFTGGLEGLWIRGTASLESAQKLQDDMNRSILLLMPLLIAGSVICSYLAVRAMLRPVSEIEKTAKEISRGADLKKRISIGKGSDELHRLADTFNSMFDDLEESFEQEKRFTSDVSHELRTPMSVISVQVEDALDGEHTNEEYMNALKVIDRQGKRMNTLINDMLDYSRIDSGLKHWPMEQFDLSALAASVSDDLALLKDNNITLNQQITPGISINGNEALLTRLIQNLISNAYHYGKENGSILVSLKSEGKTAVLSVRDDGIGIQKEQQEKIFQRFYRADVSRKSKGTGLGLSMVQKIADLHGGKVSVESEPGKGSCFKVMLPLL